MRVVITGMGAITPIGNDVTSFGEALKAGKVGVAPMTKVNIPNNPISLAAEVKDYDPLLTIDKKDVKRMDLFSRYAMSAAHEAVLQSGLDFDVVDKDRLGVIIGTGIGGMETFENEIIARHSKGSMKIAPLFIPMMIGNMAAGNVAIAYGAQGVCTNVVTACASATHSIGEAFRYIKHGYADVIFAGGAEAAITPASIAGFAALKALSRASDPARASIPFDKERGGFVLGEGAGVLILESYDHAVGRNAHILAEVVGYGANCDAHHMTAPLPDGAGAAKSMALAMQEAGINPHDIDYINAHGTSTQLNDEAETKAIKTAFGDHAYKLKISSTKSMTGHLLGAAGAIEAIAGIIAINEGFIPPTMGYSVADEQCDLDYTPNAQAPAHIDYFLSNSLGFGGHNGTLCIKRFTQTR